MIKGERLRKFKEEVAMPRQERMELVAEWLTGRMTESDIAGVMLGDREKRTAARYTMAGLARVAYRAGILSINTSALREYVEADE